MKHLQLDDMQRYLFLEGSNAFAYQCMGAHPCRRDDEEGVLFRVWAPAARQVRLTGDFNAWKRAAQAFEMHPQGDSGIWECFVAGMKPFAAYKYDILTPQGQWQLKADPYAFHSETRPGDASKVYDPGTYSWQDEQWMQKRCKADPYHSPMNIYEMHAGSWKRGEDGSVYTYERLADELVPYLKDMGYTHVEFLPLTEYPYDKSWGYQVTGYFAPTSRYGAPDGLMALIDRLHQADIGVIMDWVPAHFPRDAFGLRRFDGTALYEHEDPRRGDNPQWGTHVFDYGKGGVASFLLSSAMYWLKEYHFDGLRVDAVSYMLYNHYGREEGQWLPNRYGGTENLEAIDFLRKLNRLVFEHCPGVIMAAEEATAVPMVTRPTYLGGLGFGFKWDMGWMNDTLAYLKLDPVYRSYHHDKLTFSMMYAFNENYILALSHDEVVHGKHSLLDKMPGDYWRKFAGLRALYGYQYTHPGKKLVFMGGEFGQFIEWKDDDQLDWFLLQYDAHRNMHAYVRELNQLYRKTPALWRVDDSWDGFEWINANDSANSVISYIRRDGLGGAVVCVINFTPQYLPAYRMGFHRPTTLKPLLCSDEERFGGSGKGDRAPVETTAVAFEGRHYSAQIELAPLCAMIFEAQEKQLPRNAAVQTAHVAFAGVTKAAAGAGAGALCAQKTGL
jgi:1,4-alpha-glucan branching enzyme